MRLDKMMIKFKTWEIKIALFLSALFFFELVSLMSSAMLNSDRMIFPWTCLIFIKEEFFLPEVISGIILASFLYGVYAIWKAGTSRIIGFYFLFGSLGFVLANSLAVMIYCAWEKIPSSVSPARSYILLNSLGRGTQYHHFLLCLFLIYSIWVLFLIGRFLVKKNSSKSPLGQAHFSNVFEIKKSGLFVDDGIVLGKSHGKILKLSGFESVLVTAPTGSGKTSCIAIPNLIEWQGSGIFNDLKGELYEKTAQYREKVLGNACYRFSPTDRNLETHRYNPFYYVSENPNLRIRDLQLIAEILIPDDKVDGGFWSNSSREMFLMLSIYLFETQEMPTLGNVHDLSKIPNFIKWLQSLISSGKIKNLVFNQCANSFLSADPEKTQKNILKDFHSRMNLFVDPMIRNATSDNDFDLRELRKSKMSVYINIKDSDKHRLKSILTLFWAQFIQIMTEQEPDPEKEPYPVLAILDEFGNMEKINKLKEGMSFFRSYQIRAIVIVQYLSQIIEVYGQHGAKGFLNSKIKIAFALNDIQDAKFFSECLGRKTIQVESQSSSSGKGQSSSKNKSQQSHPLMTPDEIMSMDPDSEIILIEARPPIRAKKCPWFKEAKFYELLKTEL